MKNENLFEEIKLILWEIAEGNKYGYPSENITPETQLAEDLAVDSLDRANIAVELEKHYNISIPDDEESKWQTAEDILNFVEAKLKS